MDEVLSREIVELALQQVALVNKPFLKRDEEN